MLSQEEQEQDVASSMPSATKPRTSPNIIAMAEEQQEAAAVDYRKEMPPHQDGEVVEGEQDYTLSINIMPHYLVRQPEPEELKLIRELQDMLDKDNVVLPPSFWKANHNESRVSLFWRFIVATDLHVKQAKDLLVADIAWREEFKIQEVQKMTREEVTGVDDDLFDRHYMTRFLGYDESEGGNFSPVVYRSLSGMKTWELLEHTTHEKMVLHELWLHEQELKLLFTHPESFPARGLKVIIDVSHMVFKQATRELFSILGAFSEVSKQHHAERLSHLYIVGAPRLFSMVWKIISTFIPRNTREKIDILSSYGHDPFLTEWMPKVPTSPSTPSSAGSSPPGR